MPSTFLDVIKAAIARREDVNPKTGERQYGDVKYADPTNKKYPLDTADHVRSAWSYINMPKNARKYSPSEVATMKKRIAAEAKHFGIEINKAYATPQSTGLFDRRAGVTVFKGRDGQRYLFLVTSNSYRDRDGEAIRTKALKAYVDSAWTVEGRCLPNNPLYFWHDGDPIGDIVWADMEGPFLLEVAKERRDRPIWLTTRGTPWRTTIKTVWDALESGDIAIRWGASHGFRSVADDDGTFDRIKKFETSVLPLTAAANLITYAGVVDAAMNKDKVLEGILAMPGFAGKFRKGIRAVKSALDQAGLEHKEKKDKHVKGLLDDLTTLVQEFAAKISGGGVDEDTLVQEFMEGIVETLTKGPHAEPDEDNEDGADDQYEADGGEGATLDDVHPAAMQPAISAKQLRLLDRLTTGLEGLTADSVEMRQAITTVAKAVSPLIPMPDALTALEQRLTRIEKQLGGRPRRASEDDGTVVTDEQLTARAKQMADQLEEVFPGVKARKAEPGNGKGGK